MDRSSPYFYPGVAQSEHDSSSVSVVWCCYYLNT
ncbi:MAG: hypothetical protein UX83_C0013G0026, partial [Candidatus Wolfebacteria bacterium GW2011_GWE2_47_12]